LIEVLGGGIANDHIALTKHLQLSASPEPHLEYLICKTRMTASHEMH